MSAAVRKLSRRQALGLAAGGAAGAVALRLGVLRLLQTQAAASAMGPGGAWQSPLDSPVALAAHLGRRAGFAYTAAELDAATSMNYGDLVESVLAQKPSDLPLPEDPTKYPAVVANWYQQMATTTAQFPERMTLFWHGVFTSDFRKAARTPFVYQQNQLYRQMGRGDLRSFLIAVTYDPLMGRYLDLAQSTGQAPNENYSRELMELFTLGVGNYTENDVREGARAFSGIRAQLFDKGGNPIAAPRYTKADPAGYAQQIGDLMRQGAFFNGVVIEAQHDEGSKTFLGQTGNFQPEDALDIILRQPSVAAFLVNKALSYFAVPNPGTEYINRIADTFQKSKFDITAMMRAIFLSDEFKSGANYRSLVRSPVDYTVASLRILDRADFAGRCALLSAAMDQVLYDMPTVAGWPQNSGWLSSGTLLGRLNFASSILASQDNFPSPYDAVKTSLDGVLSADTAAVFNASGTDSDRWYALLGSPEFQLK